MNKGGNMLPFVRMFEYGNTAPEKLKVRDIISGTNSLLLITEENELWVRGNNAYGKLGIGTDTIVNVTEWTKVRDDVKFACASNLVCVVLTVDNKIFYCGDQWFESGGSTSSKVVTWKDVTTQFSAVNLSTVREMQMTYYCVGLVTNDNRLYAKGYDSNQSFSGSTSKVNAVLVASNVSKLYTSMSGTIYSSTTGGYYRSGTSNTGALGTSTNLTSYNLYSAPEFASECAVGMSTINSGILYYDTNGRTRYVIAGQNSNYQLGNSSTNTTNVYSYTELTGYRDRFGALWNDINNSAISFAIGKDGNTLYYAGSNNSLSTGDPGIEYSSSFKEVPYSFNNITKATSLANLSIVRDSSGWYYAGNATTLYGLPASDTFIPLPIPTVV
jgi:alpha-tubulin suppressor-like RCC1 family protein